MNIKKIGNVCVDSGRPDRFEKHFQADEPCYIKAIVSNVGFVDGEYPIYADIKNGRVKSIQVYFFGDPNGGRCERCGKLLDADEQSLCEDCRIVENEEKEEGEEENEYTCPNCLARISGNDDFCPNCLSRL